MATWAIGDIHGCWRTLERLLERIAWRPATDRLWLVGDLVNRGPGSLEVLRWARDHRSRLVAVLGNHDLHLIARAAGLAEERPEDDLDRVLSAPDRDELVAWLRRQPLVHRDGDALMVHAGLWPGWDADEAVEQAVAAAALLAGPEGDALLARLVSKPRPKWRQDLDGDEALAAATAVFTRLRVVRADGRVKLGFTGAPDEAPAGFRPWFETSRVVAAGVRVVFGHWAMLGLYRADRVTCLDSGCVYGGSLSALCLDDGRIVSQPVADPVPPVDHG